LIERIGDYIQEDFPRNATSLFDDIDVDYYAKVVERYNETFIRELDAI